MWGQLRIIQGGHLKIRGDWENSNMRGHTKFLGRFEKNGVGKAFRGPVTEECSGNSWEIFPGHQKSLLSRQLKNFNKAKFLEDLERVY